LKWESDVRDLCLNSPTSTSTSTSPGKGAAVTTRGQADFALRYDFEKSKFKKSSKRTAQLLVLHERFAIADFKPQRIWKVLKTFSVILFKKMLQVVPL
jgi:hypothetical protein